MTSTEDLSPEARQLLRQAKGADRATRSEVTSSVQRFRHANAYRPAWRQSRTVRSSRRATSWAVFVAILSGTLGAYATVGQSLGLPLPGWWPEFALLPAASDATAEQVRQANLRSEKAHVGEGRRGDMSRAAATSPSTNSAAFTSPTGAEISPVKSSAAEPAPSPRTTTQPSMALRAASTQSSPSNTTPRAVSASTPDVSRNPSATAGPLAQEVQTITAARDALNAGNCALAAHHLDTHRLQFPQGALSEERHALSAICQCRRGQGTTAAAVYVARRPNSPLARRVATECALDKP